MKRDPQKTEKTVRTVILIALILYVIFLLWLTVFGRESDPDAVCYKGELFWSIRGAIADPQGMLPGEILGNCFVLTPVGFAVAWLFGPEVFGVSAHSSIDSGCNRSQDGAKGKAARRRSYGGICLLLITMAAGLLLSCTIEILQLTLRRGLFEYDDIIYNVFGAAVGYFLYLPVRHICRKWDKAPDALSQKNC